MTFEEVYKQLESLGDPKIKTILIRHGAKEPFFGVKVEYLKKILKITKKNHELSLALYQTGNSDAMYLAALMADEKKMTKEILQNWVENAYWSYLHDYAVPWVAAESAFGFELGLKWIDSEIDTIQAAGWATLGSIAALKNDDDLDIPKYGNLIIRISQNINNVSDTVRAAMNNFMISVGCSVAPLSQYILETSTELGKLNIDMGETNCKVPYAPDYINKVISADKLGKKRKSARC